MKVGFVEALRAFQVRGWAFDHDEPARRLEVELRLSGSLIGAAVADQPREDLRDAGMGDGAHGFIINVNTVLPTESPGSFRVNVVGESNALPFASPLHVETSTRTESGVETKTSPLMGFFSVGDIEVAGWAYDPTSPSSALRVELKSAGRSIATRDADIFKPDLITICDGYADHGFRFPIGEMAFDVPITVVAIDTLGIEAPLVEIPRPGSEEQQTLEAKSKAPSLLRFPGEAVDQNHRPVFILGAARSGTSAMVQALARATKYKGPEEGHFFDLVIALLRGAEKHYECQGEEIVSADRSTLISTVPLGFVEEGIKHIFIALAREQFPSGYWTDKTPRLEIIAAAPLLLSLWPQARFIFMRRRGLENLSSRLRKFRGVSFERHCRDWADAMTTWQNVRNSLGPNAIEIDQMDLARSPETVVRALASGLDISEPEQLVLEAAIKNDQPERTSVDLGRPLDLRAMPWSPEQFDLFGKNCSRIMDAFGYSEDESYWVRRSTLAWGAHIGA